MTEVDTNVFNTSNATPTRIDNLPQPDITPFRLISDSYTKAEDDTGNINTSYYTNVRIAVVYNDLAPFV